MWKPNLPEQSKSRLLGDDFNDRKKDPHVEVNTTGVDYYYITEQILNTLEMPENYCPGMDLTETTFRKDQQTYRLNIYCGSGNFKRIWKSFWIEKIDDRQYKFTPPLEESSTEKIHS